MISCGRAPAAASCPVPDARVPDVAGRSDGLYGVVDDRAGERPLARFDRMTRLSEGVDAESGKRWIRVHLADDEAHALEEFTAAPQGKSIAVVAGGEVACLHKIRTSLTSGDLQVSCCNPRACDRWVQLLPASPGSPRAP
jgi:preprotein translocase subunit SecD